MSYQRIQVRTPGAEYPVLIGSGTREELPRLISEIGPSILHVITDSNVERLHGEAVLGILRGAGRPLHAHVLPAGEVSKSPPELLRLWREIIRAGCDRHAAVLALGGGVVGDLAGFAAATILRGIDFIQVPTTLLAMVDASVGGKTGIDLPEGKNLVGAFHQPRAVVMDLDFLETLPGRELGAGWAEVIKTAAIRDAALFARLERERGEALRRDPRALSAVVRACVEVKADVVGADERESGLRRILNFGHTLAHGLETLSGYSDMPHGEAVAVGMVFAAELGEAVGLTERGTSARLRACVEAYGLPAAVKGVSPADLHEILGRDKKRGPAGIRWVLLSRIGEAVVPDSLPEERVEAVLARFLGRMGNARAP